MSQEQEFRAEMKARKTRHYKRQVIKEMLAGVATFILVIVFLLLAMAVFPD